MRSIAARVQSQAVSGDGAGEELQLLRKWKWKLFIDTNKSKANLRELQIKHRQTYLFNEYQRIARSTFLQTKVPLCSGRI